MKPLYELVAEYRELERLDLDEVPEEALLDTLEGLQGLVLVKATNVAKFTLNLEAFADAVDAAAKKMAERAARLRRRADIVRNYLLINMQAAKITKVEAPEFTISVRKNPPAVVVDFDADVDNYMIQPLPPPRLDKKQLSDDLKAGIQVYGCHLEQSERLEIRS